MHVGMHPHHVNAARVQAYVAAVRDHGQTFFSPTCYAGSWGMRAAFSNWRTGEEDVERAFASLVVALD